MFGEVQDNMNTSSSSSPPNSSHPSSEMYYTNVLFGHPLFAPSVLLQRNNESGSQAQPPTTQNEGTLSLNDDFIELDVMSDSATTLSGDETDDHHFNSSLPSSSNFANHLSSSENPQLSTSLSGLNLQQASNYIVNSLSSRSDIQSNIPRLQTESQGLEQPPHSLEQFRPSNADVDESSPIPRSSLSHLSPSNCDAFLMSEHEIAQGNSITSTVVNLLRGCNLLDSHSLEDLCNYLPILRDKYPPLTSNLPPHSIPSSTSHARRQQIQKKSSSLPSRLTTPSDGGSDSPEEVLPKSTRSNHGGRMVDYLLTCSHLGSTSISDFHHIAGGEDSGKRMRLPLDWRRGRSDGLVGIVGASRSLASRVMGRFVTDVVGESGDAEDLGHWISSWIRSGAVIFFAQLDTPASRTGGDKVVTRCHNQTNVCCELTWRHRLVYGITNNTYVHLSNPIEKIHVRSLMTAFNTKATICVPKLDLLNLWRSDEAPKQNPFDGAPATSYQDLSLLAVHSDPRWCEFNVLGQVIATLRERDWGMERQSQGQNSMEPSISNGIRETTYQENLRCEPHLVVPCDQRPGFSLFLPRNASLDEPLKHLIPQPLYS